MSHGSGPVPPKSYCPFACHACHACRGPLACQCGSCHACWRLVAVRVGSIDHVLCMAGGLKLEKDALVVPFQGHLSACLDFSGTQRMESVGQRRCPRCTSAREERTNAPRKSKCANCNREISNLTLSQRQLSLGANRRHCDECIRQLTSSVPVLCDVCGETIQLTATKRNHHRSRGDLVFCQKHEGKEWRCRRCGFKQAQKLFSYEMREHVQKRRVLPAKHTCNTCWKELGKGTPQFTNDPMRSLLAQKRQEESTRSAG